MKKCSIALLISVCLILLAGLAVSADNTVYTSNTMAYIDNEAIPQYVYNGESYIVAEDLQGYGFDISWNGKTEILDIYYNPFKTWTPYNFDDIEPTFVREKMSTVVSSNTRVRLDGDYVNAYSLDGRMLISMTDLWRYGKVNYYPVSDSISFTSNIFMEYNPDWQTLLPAYELNESIRYARNSIGQVTNAIDDTFGGKLYYENDILYINQGNINRAKSVQAFLQERLYHLNQNPNFYYKGDFVNYINSALSEANKLVSNINRIHGYTVASHNWARNLPDINLDDCDSRYDNLDAVITPYITTW
ncbi:MAG: hypothetical protein E7399_01305 [Ruminococcaceae bacterium]|nr:hypothetical protein [Oscillospiraceae bacterium]